MRPRSPLQISEQSEVLDRLSKKYGKYALVVGVARRAHELKERVDSALEPGAGGLINRAISEIAGGEVRIRGEMSEEDSE
jgi:DNA-directed RNA polymerase subunit K/omega